MRGSRDRFGPVLVFVLLLELVVAVFAGRLHARRVVLACGVCASLRVGRPIAPRGIWAERGSLVETGRDVLQVSISHLRADVVLHPLLEWARIGFGAARGSVSGGNRGRER